MAAAAILDFSEVKFDISASRGLPVSTSRPNLVKISQRAAELWRFMCFQNGGMPPSWILVKVKFGGIFVSGISVLVSVPNFMRICKIATELWPLKWFSKWRPPLSWIFRNWNLMSPEVAGGPYLPPHQIWWRYLKERPSYGDLCVFKMAAAAILNLLPVSIFFIYAFLDSGALRFCKIW